MEETVPEVGSCPTCEDHMHARIAHGKMHPVQLPLLHTGMKVIGPGPRHVQTRKSNRRTAGRQHYCGSICHLCGFLTAPYPRILQR